MDAITDSLHQGYTEVIDADLSKYFDSIPQQNFLGFEIGQRTSWKSGKRYTHVASAAQSIAKLKALTARERTPAEFSEGVRAVNSTLGGWTGYFHYRNSSHAMTKVKTHAEERLRTHQMKRHKVKDRGTGLGRFHSELLYARYRLYKVLTKAGWTLAHASV